MFTATGTVSHADGTAFSLGQTLTLVLVTHPALDALAPNTTNDTTAVEYSYTIEGETPIWSQVALTGTTGQWADTPDGLDPHSFVYSDDLSAISMIASTDRDGGIGLFAGNVEIQTIWLTVEGLNPGFETFPGDETANPNTIWDADGIGDFAFGAFTITALNSGNEFEYYDVDLTSFTVTAGSAIPEPATTAGVLGLLAVCVVGWRRWRR